MKVCRRRIVKERRRHCYSAQTLGFQHLSPPNCDFGWEPQWRECRNTREVLAGGEVLGFLRGELIASVQTSFLARKFSNFKNWLFFSSRPFVVMDLVLSVRIFSINRNCIEKFD